jgi:hypothetical protein
MAQADSESGPSSAKGPWLRVHDGQILDLQRLAGAESKPAQNHENQKDLITPF